MSHATERDRVLLHILENGEVNFITPKYLFEEEEDKEISKLFYTHKAEFIAQEYINYRETFVGVNNAYMALVTHKGEAFLNNGGYTVIEQQQQREEYRKDAEWKWRRGYESGSLVVAGVATIISLLTYFNTPKSSDIEKLQSQIDSLKRKVPRSVKIPPTVLPVVAPPISNTLIKKKT